MKNNLPAKFGTLFILSYGAIGDFCVILFFLEQVHLQAPNARLIVLTTKNEGLLRDMASMYPAVEIVPIRPLPLLKCLLQTFYRKNIFIVPPTFFDVPRFAGVLSRMFTAVGGKVVGFTSKARVPSFDVVVPFKTKDLFYKNFNALLHVLGFQSEDSFQISFARDATAADALGKGYIAVAPFASTQHKTLPPGRWVSLLSYLAEKYPERKIALLGAPSDAAAAYQYVSDARIGNAQVLCGIPFAQTADVLAKASCYVGIDSGLSHVAGVQHAPSVIVENLRTPMYLLTYNPNALVLFETKNCICDGERGKECFWIIDGLHYSRCMVDVPQERIEKAIADTIEKYG